ncbi:MAG: hypothetical protein KDE15_12540 [Erythrobacter sp.]|nr:hypothetical protein [Erythrobacter sp.]
MTKPFALVGALSCALALSACGDSEEDAATEAEIPAEVAASAATFVNAGIYRSTTAQGSGVVVSLLGDGTYTITNGGEQAEAGIWQDSDTGVCLTAEGGFSESCFAIAPGEEPNTRLITDPAGTTSNYTFEG